jgi:hypothetical protein
LTDPNPAILAQMDQHIATVGEHVDRYVDQVAGTIRQVGYGPAITDFHAFLQRQPAAPVGTLAAVAIARLAAARNEAQANPIHHVTWWQGVWSALTGQVPRAACGASLDGPSPETDTLCTACPQPRRPR